MALIHRRSLLLGLVATPVIVRASSLDLVRGVIMDPRNVIAFMDTAGWYASLTNQIVLPSPQILKQLHEWGYYKYALKRKSELAFMETDRLVKNPSLIWRKSPWRYRHRDDGTGTIDNLDEVVHNNLIF